MPKADRPPTPPVPPTPPAAPAAPATPSTAPPALTPAQLRAQRIEALPRFYSWKDILASVYDGDEDAFTSGWCDGTLPLAVRQQILDTMPPTLSQMFLLRRIVRQNDLLLQEVRKS